MSNSSTENAKSHGSVLKTLLFLVIIGLSAFIWYGAIYGNADQTSGHLQLSFTDYTTIDHIQVNYNAQITDVNIEYRDTEEFIYEGHWSHTYITADSDFTPLELTQEVELSPDNTTLIITIEDNQEFTSLTNFMVYSEIECDIIISNQYLQNLTTEISTGSIELNALNTEFVGIDLSHTTGNIEIRTENSNISEMSVIGSTGSFLFEGINTEISEELKIVHTTGNSIIYLSESQLGAITSISSTGRTDIQLYETTFSEDINIESTTGSVEFDISATALKNINSVGSTGRFELDARESTIQDLKINRSTGNVYIELYQTIAGRIFSTANTGSFDLRAENVELEADLDVYRTTGSIDINLVDIIINQDFNANLEANTGRIEVDWENTLKISNQISVFAKTTTGNIDVSILTPEETFSYFLIQAESDTSDPDIEISELED